MLTISGILTDPVGETMGETEIRFTTYLSPHTLPYAVAVVETSYSGSYEFTLKDGVYEVEYNQSDEYTKPIMIEVPADVTSTLTMEELVANYTYTDG